MVNRGLKGSNILENNSVGILGGGTQGRMGRVGHEKEESDALWDVGGLLALLIIQV